ncbi:MAG: hypothetical protein JWN74_38 [Acidobacteriaceae bacterium]|nr:hypothetical protein [Acidobacteriaceae bacterium]
MEIKRTISRVIYRIEPKPEGGFIARCDDPTVPPLEGATRFELQQQIQDKITSEVESQIPGLKISLEKKFVSLDTKTNGFTAQSGDTSLQSAEGGTKKAVEQWLTDKAVALVEKNLPPELVEQLKHQQIDGKVKIAVTKLGTEGKVRREYILSNGNAGELLSRFLKGRQKNSGALEPSSPVSSSFSNTSLDGNSPITPVGSSSFLRFLAAALVLVGVLFFFLYLKK